MNSLSTSSSELEVINLDNAVIGILSDDPMFATGLKSILKKIAPLGQGAVVDSDRTKFIMVDLDSLNQSIFHLVRSLSGLRAYDLYRIVFWTSNQAEHTLNFVRLIDNASFINKKAPLESVEQAVKQVLSGRRFVTQEVQHTFQTSNGPGRVTEETFTILDDMMSGMRVKCIAAKLNTADKSIYSKLRQFRERLSLLRKSDFLSFIHDIS
ncbi:response regulator transcription factor [Hafnia paralvei]|uniref:response regulator transcription factor n=1 Tax=Hafnia paralvei TaxID=546367 RepID=UPI0010344710|nr:response regulator transcription factor [Hafnia paralvei]NIH32812.1 response regulator transcription factor [Hafnia paralvei]TBM04974.1 response regulator transcription factor [Hafnia paralvei]